ncbi:MAG: phosphoribosylpyrophosphate synthetase [Myxococcota bacterium]
MLEPETLSQAIKRFNARGYTEDFRAHAGKLKATPADKLFQPTELSVDETFRLEGDTNLEDELILFALSDPSSGLKGTYVSAYSTNMDPLDVDIMQKLSTPKA